jgi:hypothetical protein
MHSKSLPQCHCRAVENGGRAGLSVKTAFTKRCRRGVCVYAHPFSALVPLISDRLATAVCDRWSDLPAIFMCSSCFWIRLSGHQHGHHLQLPMIILFQGVVFGPQLFPLDVRVLALAIAPAPALVRKNRRAFTSIVILMESWNGSHRSASERGLYQNPCGRTPSRIQPPGL